MFSFPSPSTTLVHSTSIPINIPTYWTLRSVAICLIKHSKYLHDLFFCRRKEPKNPEYNRSFLRDSAKNYSSGYVHPYHTSSNPVIFTHFTYLKTLLEAMGPEQVSPHYESLSRSRRGLIFGFLYISTISTISRLGGWSHNDWLRGMIFHHEFLICLYLAQIESRHFSFVLGPKFTIFYNAYTRYEIQQFASQWADTVEEIQQIHLQPTKQQIEYVRINKEYEFVKKRALVNFLQNSKDSLESHFKGRAQNMLNQIQRYEQTNLKNLLQTINQ